MAPATASRSSAPIKFLYPRRKPIRTLANLKPMYTASPMRANRAITRQEAYYTRHQRSSACPDYAPTRLGRPPVSSSNRTISSFWRPRASLGACGEVTCLRSARSAAWFLPRISRIKETILLSAVHQPHPQCRPGKFRLCGDNPGPLGCSIGRIGQPVAPALGATMIRPRVSRIGGRFILGDTGTFVFLPNKL